MAKYRQVAASLGESSERAGSREQALARGRARAREASLPPV